MANFLRSWKLSPALPLVALAYVAVIIPLNTQPALGFKVYAELVTDSADWDSQFQDSVSSQDFPKKHASISEMECTNGMTWTPAPISTSTKSPLRWDPLFGQN